MSGFSIDWLDLRETADSAARSSTLIKQLVDVLQADADIAPIIIDLGSGTGATLRALRNAGAQRCVWRLVDHNPALLNEALRRHAQQETIEDYELDLRETDALPLGGGTLLASSALFDLVSAPLTDALLARVGHYRMAFYAALNYDGRTQWTPSHAFDSQVLAAFNRHQRRDKGTGPALGTEAVPFLKTALERLGYRVQIADSCWQLDGGHAALLSELINNMRTAVAELLLESSTDNADWSEALDDWHRFRLSHIAEGSCVIGHQDVLALPD